ncbi:hypothetical protein CKO09_07540 [Chromatium weissei]|nr:hypothetical protein [Chromatium weissei]
MLKHYISVYLLAFLISILFTACSTNPSAQQAQYLASIPTSKLERATALETQGKFADAAELYLNLATKVAAPARTQLQLNAARAYLSAGQTTLARQTLAAIPAPNTLPTMQQAVLQLTQANVALLEDRPQDAIALLKRLPVRALSPEQQRQRLGNLAAAQRLSHQPLAAAKTLNLLDQQLDDANARLLNQVSLLATLNQLNDAEIKAVIHSGEVRLKGWAEIAQLARQARDNSAAFSSEYRQWRQTHPRHSALPGLARAYAATLSGGYAPGTQVTIMLPRSGYFAAAAQAIRAGITAAYQADDSPQRPTLTFVDSTQDKRLLAIHAKAIADGVDYVIGPLQKAAVDDLAAQRVLTVPTLALNETTQPDKRADNLFQFSLSPENEAAEVANQAYAHGLRQALLLYPNDVWGDRLAQAFLQKWGALGGVMRGQARYVAGDANTAPLGKLLDDNAADLLFLVVATPETARQLYSSIHLAAPPTLTVMTTSHVYSGAHDASRNAVLNGLCFVDIPWMLTAHQNITQGRADSLARLYAMGIDAYRLLPRLTDLANNAGGYYSGQTGGLSVDQVGRIQRQLQLNCFGNDGEVRPAQ